jgi:LacI family transcriptional regulator
VTALLRGGHRNIAVLGGERSVRDSLALRAQGAEDAFRQAGLPFDDGRYVKIRLTLADAYAAAMDYFRRCPDTTAAFCMSDTAALGVIRALADLGLSVPRDVSVIGVDGIDIGRFTTPRLSTVAQPVKEIARQSMKVLAELMENGGPVQHVTVKASLELRESVRQVRSEKAGA